jgi:hypothetical protein
MIFLIGYWSTATTIVFLTTSDFFITILDLDVFKLQKFKFRTDNSHHQHFLRSTVLSTASLLICLAMKMRPAAKSTALAAVFCLRSSVEAFVSPRFLVPYSISADKARRQFKHRTLPCNTLSASKRKTLVTRHMYKLPPGGGGNNDNGLRELLGGVVTVAALALFFFSPLGSIFFAITNSLFLLAILLPVVGVVAFQAWRFLNTISGACPNCGAPVTVLKDQNSPSVCLSCGSFVRASDDKSNIEVIRGDASVDRGFAGSTSIFDIFERGSSSPTVTGNDDKQSKYRRERTIIDVEVEDD